MEAAEFNPVQSPKGAPKLLSVATMAAVLEVRFGLARPAIAKMKQTELLEEMKKKLASAATSAS